MTNEDLSSSGILHSTPAKLSNTYTERSVMYSTSYCQLIKAKKYGRWYVLKTLLPQYAESEFYKNLLEKEAEISLKLSHPCIVPYITTEYVYGIGQCLIMDYVDGFTLDEYLRMCPSKDELNKLTNQILDAMVYFHSLQVIHRDLKPSNILVTRNGRSIKVIDFGLSDTDSYAVLKQPAGTQKYASPEQMDDTVTIDSRSDIYSLGIILKKMYACKHSLLYKYIAYKCTRKNRDERFQSAADIQNFIANVKNGRVFFSLLAGIALLLLIFQNLGSGYGNRPVVVHDTIYTIKEVQTIVYDTTKEKMPTQSIVVHDTVVVPYKLSPERKAVHNIIREFVNKKMEPICKKVKEHGFLFDYTLRASTTACFLHCQKELRNKLIGHVSSTYPKSALYVDIDSVSNSIISSYRMEHEDEFPSYEDAMKLQAELASKKDSASVAQYNKIHKDIFEKFDDDVVKYE